MHAFLQTDLFLLFLAIWDFDGLNEFLAMWD